MREVQPTQLRLGFTRPQPPMRWYLDLSGLFVLITPDAPGTDDDVAAALADIGVTPEIRPHLGVCLPAAQLRHLASLRADITVTAADAIYTLWQLVKFPAPPTLPATLVRHSERSFLVEWEHNGAAMEAHLELSATLALLASDIPFVATPDAWELIDAATRTTPVTGRVTVSLDGFLEISSARPQLVEALDLPGLFRLDATHFGLPLAAREALVSAQSGLIIDALVTVDVPAPTPPVLDLSHHHLADLDELTNALSAYQAQVVFWESGLGRRVFALAAVDRLDAWPALIISTPAHLWAWQRHLDLMGRSYSLNHAEADAHLVTYHDLARRRRLPPFPSIIFDQITSPEAHAAYPALRRLAGLRDSYRIALDSDWPDDQGEQVEILEILRPGEFRSDVPLAERYPPDAHVRAQQHINFYLSVRHRDDPDVDHRPFRRSSTRVVSLTQAHQLCLEELAERLSGSAASSALAEILEAVTAGPSSMVSPKLAAAGAIAKKEAAKEHACAIVTRSRKAATLLRSMLRPIPVEAVEPGAIATPRRGGASIVRFERGWPDLRGFDHVVVLDYPWSLSVIDAAVGPASAPGADRVTVVHAVDTIDDRLAVLASRRRELAGVSDDTAPPTLDEIVYLFAPRP